VLDLALMAREFGSKPSSWWGFEDLGIAIDFDKACLRRLQLFDCEIEQRKIDALNSHRDGATAPPQPMKADELDRLFAGDPTNN
jgi:hypothetical protein